MAYLKPQAPLMQGADYVYPITTADQVVMDDNSRLSAYIANAVKFCSFSIATDGWSGSGPYTYTISKSAITSDMAIINLTLDSTSQSYLAATLDWETTDGSVIFSTTSKPTGVISGYFIATKAVEI